MHVRVATLAVFVSFAGLALGADELIVSRGADADGRAVGLHLDVAGFGIMNGVTRLGGVELSPGEFFDLVVEPTEVIDPRGRGAVAADGDEEHPIDLSGLTLVHGEIVGDPGSLVYLAVSPWGVHGVVETGDESRRWSVSSGPYDPLANAGDAWVMAADEFEFTGAFECGVEAGGEYDLTHLHGEVGEGGGGAGESAACRIARIAIDSEWEMTRDFGGDPQAAAAYAVSLFGAVSEIYERELNVRLTLPYIRMWESNTDPYNSGTDASALLNQFRSHWSSQMGSVDREIAHVLSPKVSGGVAWVGVLCNRQYGYAASGLDLYFPYPLVDHNNGNWDLVVTAHETGHNFGTLHTHDGYSPPIDNCGNGDCTGAYGGTIMSYCHLCGPRGMGNIVLSFHDRVKGVINDYLDNDACSIDGSDVLAGVDESALTAQSVAVEIDVLANELSGSCLTDITLDSVDATSAGGGLTEVLAGFGPDGRDLVRYTPAIGFNGVDSFGYVVRSGADTASATTTIDVAALREPDDHGAVSPGVDVAWYDLPTGIAALPPFGFLTPSSTSEASEINYASTSGAFSDSGFSDTFGAVYEGYIQIPTEGFWTLSVESDDGSAMWIGDEEIIDNDGLHGMQEVSSVEGLEAGLHRVRVEFFENTGGAGLIVRWSGPGVGRAPVPASAWFRDAVCAADVTGDGDVNTNDFFEFLSLYQAGDSRADFEPGGGINTNDFFAYLAAYQAGC